MVECLLGLPHSDQVTPPATHKCFLIRLAAWLPVQPSAAGLGTAARSLLPQAGLCPSELCKVTYCSQPLSFPLV